MNAAEANETHVGEPPPRPVALRVVPENIPAELRALPQWVVWRYELRGGKGDKKQKWTKPPFAANGGNAASSTDPATWAPFEEALDAYERGGWDGLGLVHAPGDNLGIIDLDHVRDGETAAIEPWAAAIVALMDTYAETSPSGTGLRIVAHGRKPGRKAKRGPVEIYDGLTADGGAGGRYLTFTGHRLDGAPLAVNDRQDQLAEVYQQYLVSKPSADQAAKSDGATPRQANGHTEDARNIFARTRTTWSPPDGPLSDEDMVKLAESGLDEKLTRLWNGDIASYPSQSEADPGLCCKLLWWMGVPDKAQLDRLFRQSRLMRPKWDEQHGEKTYGRITIDYAIGVQTDYRQSKAEQVAAAGDEGQEPQLAHGMILAYFKDRYRPVFRRGPAIYSEALRRDVKQSEAVATPDIQIIARLAAAGNAPKTKNGKLNVNALPGFFTSWARVAFGTLLKALPDEDKAEEVAEGAEAEFREKVSRGLKHFVTIGETEYQNSRQGRVEVTQTQRRPILCFACNGLTSQRWAQVRDYSIWARSVGGRPEVAVRGELFAEIGYRPLEDMTHNRFRWLCEHYGIGEAARATGQRAVVLAPDFIDGLIVTLPEVEPQENGQSGEA